MTGPNSKVCLSVIDLACYVDGALSPKQARAAGSHIESCASCQSTVSGFRRENTVIRTSLRLSPAEEAAVEPAIPSAPSESPAIANIPELLPRPAIPATLAWLTCAVLGSWMVNLAWMSASASLALPNWLRWLLPGSLSTATELAIETAQNLFSASANWLPLVTGGLASGALLVLSIAAIWLLGQRRIRSNPSFCMVLGLLALTITAVPNTYAFDLRHDEQSITVGPEEVIDDTLILSAERVAIEGKITGDLIVIGERVRIVGSISGSVISAAEELTIEGQVSGNVVAAGEIVDVRSATIGGNVYSIGETITLRTDTKVAGNTLLAGETLNVYATINRDLVALGSEATLHGSVVGNARFYGEELELVDGSKVGGSLFAMLASEDSITSAPSATVTGETTVSRWPEDEEEHSIFGSLLEVVLKVVAALLSGLLLFWLFPSLRQIDLFGPADGAITAALGAAALVATPLLALVIALTLIGAPIGLSVFLFWLIALYVSLLITANYVGRQMLDEAEHGWLKPLLLGILVVVPLMNLPWIGGLLQVAAMVLGAGLLIRWLRSSWAER